MESIGVFFILLSLSLLILQIVMIIKFFQIADDMKAVRTIIEQNLNKSVQNENAEIVPTAKVSVGDLQYTEDGNIITFSNGLSGEVKKKFGEWCISTSNGNQSFDDKKVAIKQLFKDLTA